MAGFVKKPLNLVSDIIFEGALLSDTRAALVTELLKYILYERQQIPLPADQLKLRVDASTSGKADKDGCLEKINSKKFHTSRPADRKEKLFLEDLESISDNFKKSFTCCPEIDQVLILIGGTAVSPKESYVIKFPPPCPDADCLPLTVCKYKLFRQIIGEDVLGSLNSTLMPSNIMVLLSAPRTFPIEWFLPKHSVSPKMKTVISFNIQCLYLVPICHDLSITDCDTTDISGLEALECSLCDSGKKCFTDENDGDDLERSEKEVDETKILHRCKKQSCDDFGRSRTTSQSNPVKKKDQDCHLNRFCEHKKLNYIFSSHKRGRLPVVNSPDGLHSFSISCHMSSTPGVDFKDDSLIPQYTTQHTESSFPHTISSDYIWYQSPVILKGFKDQEDRSQTLKFI